MRISQLAEATGVGVPTLKFYLREGVLPAGEPVSRTLADYGERHVERVRLIRALIDAGGLGMAEVRQVIAALDDPPVERHLLLGAAHAAIPAPLAPSDDAELKDHLRELLHDLGWEDCDDEPLIAALASAVASARSGGVAIDDDVLRRYATAERAVAAVDVDEALAAGSAAAAMQVVVLGTVLVDPVLVALRRLAQAAESFERSRRGGLA